MAVSDFLPILMPLAAKARQDIHWQKTGPKTKCVKKPLSTRLLRRHLDGGDKVGVCPIQEGGTTTQIAVLDLDSHKGETPWQAMVFAARSVIEKLKSLNMNPVACRSSGGQGIHIFLIWDNSQDAFSVRKFLADDVLKPLGFKNGTAGLHKGQIEIFPKQDFVPMGGCGSQFILPMAGLSVPLLEMLDYDAGERVDWKSFEFLRSPSVAEREKEIVKPKVERLIGDDIELKVIESALAKVDPDCDYDTWLKIGMGLHAGTQGGDEGLELWDDWSSKALTQYQGRIALEAKWHSFRLDKEKSISIDTVKKIASEAGWVEDYSVDFEEVKDEELYDEKGMKKRRFQPISADAYLKRPKVEWLIKGVLPKNSAGMTYGGSGDGKTFAVLDMACAIALGIEWNGRKVKRGKVIYICAEGAGGFITRIEAYAKKNKISKKELGEWLSIIPAAPNFLKKDEVIELAKEITGHYPETALVIIDTLAQTTTGGDENSAKDMNLMQHHVAILRDLTKAASHLVHHTGKDEDRGARGSSTLKADCDVQLCVSRDGDSRQFWVAKMKDGIDGFGWAFALETVTLTEDEDGELITSCVVRYGEQVSTKAKKSKPVAPRKKGYWEDAILKAVDGSPNARIEDIINEVVANAPYDPADGKDRRRGNARRAIESLQKAEELQIENNRIITDLSAA